MKTKTLAPLPAYGEALVRELRWRFERALTDKGLESGLPIALHDLEVRDLCAYDAHTDVCPLEGTDYCEHYCRKSD